MRAFRNHFSRYCLLVALLTGAVTFAADWPPALDRSNTTIQSQDGLTIERYTHGPRDVWGYPSGNTNEWVCPAAPEIGVPGQNHGPIRKFVCGSGSWFTGSPPPAAGR